MPLAWRCPSRCLEKTSRAKYLVDSKRIRQVSLANTLDLELRIHDKRAAGGGNRSGFIINDVPKRNALFEAAGRNSLLKHCKRRGHRMRMMKRKDPCSRS